MDIEKLVKEVVNKSLETEIQRLNENLSLIKEVIKNNNQDMELLKVKEAKQILGIGVSGVYKLIEKGEIAALDLNGLKIPRYEIQDFIKRNLGKKVAVEDESA